MSKKSDLLLNWNSGFSFKPPAANSLVYLCIQVCGISIFEIRRLDLKARVQGPREPRELELGLTQSHMTQKPLLRVKWMRVRCACKSDRGWVVQASAVSAMRLGVGVVSLFGH